jgi:HK97 family phage major capsid protein
MGVRVSPAEINQWAAAAKLRATTTSDLVRDATNAAITATADELTRVTRGAAYASDPRPYTMDGRGHSFVRDSWSAYFNHDADAEERLRRFARWQRDFSAAFSVSFATTTTATGSSIVPPGYRPLLAEFVADRPLYAAATRQGLSDATPFTVPANLTEASVGSAAAAHVEGNNPTDGTLTLSGATVTPTAVSGLFRCTREVVDSSNPAIDAIALAVMREDYARQTEERIFTELNTVQAGTITAGLVPSGAMARTSAGTALPGDLRKAVLAFTDTRKARPRSVVASSRPSVAEALDGVGGAAPVPGLLDSSSVPAGSEDIAVVGGCGVRLSPFITGTAAGDGDAFVLGSGDLYAWASPVFEFRFSERGGPTFVDLAIFGYFATRMINSRGLASVRHT